MDKPGLVVGGMPMLAGVVGAAAAAGAGRIVVVGPRRDRVLGERSAPGAELVFVREDPPGAGPVPALRAGLSEVAAPLVAVLAADLPFLRGRHLGFLLAPVRGGAAGAVMLDDAGWPQWLLGCWRSAVLRAALRGYRGRSLHGLLGSLEPAMVRVQQEAGEPPPWLDCDTPEELARARRLAARSASLEREASG